MLNIIFKNGRKTITKNNKRIQIRLSSNLYNDKDNSSNNKAPRNVKKSGKQRACEKGNQLGQQAIISAFKIQIGTEKAYRWVGNQCRLMIFKSQSQ